MWEWGYGRATMSVGVVVFCMSSAVYVSLLLAREPVVETEITYIDAVTAQRVSLAAQEHVPVASIQGRIIPKGLPLECDNTGDHPYLLALRPASSISSSVFYVHCPSSCSALDGEVYGTGPYASKSSLCLAAIHAGAIDRKGGVVQVEVSSEPFAGRGDKFGSSLAHGIHSRALHDHRTQFTVQRATDLDVSRLPAITASCMSNSLEAPFANRSLWLVRCPAHCSFTKGKGLLIWGGHPYTSDSSVCFAAIHAGVATQDTASSFVVEQVGGQQSFRGSTENGVTTRDWKMFPARFYIYDFGHHVSCDMTFEKFYSTVEFTDGKWKIVCPSSCLSGSVYGGEGVYAAASVLCRSAQHAGFLPESGGEVEVRANTRTASFPASLSNGVFSKPLASSAPSFTLSQITAALQCSTRLEREDESAKMLFTSRSKLRVTCPFGCGIGSGVVRGTQFYDASSSICLSAVHAGVIRRQEGGEFVLVKHPSHRGSSAGSSRNGIISDALKEGEPMFVFSVEAVPTD